MEWSSIGYVADVDLFGGCETLLGLVVDPFGGPKDRRPSVRRRSVRRRHPGDINVRRRLY